MWLYRSQLAKWNLPITPASLSKITNLPEDENSEIKIALKRHAVKTCSNRLNSCNQLFLRLNNSEGYNNYLEIFTGLSHYIPPETIAPLP